LKTILLVAAGTGGHIFPALALAEELVKQGMYPVLAGRPRSLEQELARAAGVEFMNLTSSGFFGKGPLARLGFGVNAASGFAQALRIMRRKQPDAVVAAGGFGSVAPLVAARLAGRPYFLLEQNRIPGRVVRYFSPWAAEVFLTFDLLKPLAARTRVTGTPLRRKLLSRERRDPGNTVLVLGGSQGARALNTAAVEMARALPQYRFVVQTGRRDYALVKEQATGLANMELTDFTLDMEELYAQASLVVSRAGGMAINEILAFGLPSILVPFPFAIDNHQKANAQHVALQGASINLVQSRLPEIPGIVAALMADPVRRTEMSASARRIARSDAAQLIADRIQHGVGHGDSDAR
jgi:UDP-N-acetylglucosamine--N-acetylmuramyl-(pentapeptide) pyrophosphoryl-undecaprenol N-acetylglucosamine transferase